ncbi:NAD(P)-dependent alcohol dehydrogenase [Pullulanibacillus camelliae]|nr:NAD(P)-dependent alcohol dehydrogenase [Pullulanibacillus camelliae]
MKAAILEKPLSIDVHQIERPVPQADEALIKVACIGVCGSDLHYYEHGKIGRYVVEKPIILGHELSGEVIEVGENVSGIKPGDRVAVEPGITCGTCDYCKAGRYNLCPDVQFLATPPVDGAWAEYVSIRSDFLHKIPDSMSDEEAALIEPFSVGFHAMKRGKVGPGDRVLIQGLGPIGLLAIQAAKLFGASEIYASDVIDFRLEAAEKLGINGTIHPLKGDSAAQLQALTGGRGVNKLIETSGNEKAVSDAIHLVNRGGTIVYVGLPVQSAIPMDVAALVDAELDIYGVFRYVNTYPAAIQALAHSDTDIRGIITDRFALDDIKEAVEKARLAKETTLKVMIYPDGMK